MAKSVHEETIRLLLSAIYCNAGLDGLKHSFMFGEPGAPHWDQRFGTEIYYSRKLFIQAVLYVRQQGPAHLRYLSVKDVWMMLTNFVSHHFWHLFEETSFKRFDCSFGEIVSDTAKAKMALALVSSAIFVPKNSPTLFPLVPVHLETDFASEPFFLVRPKSLEPLRQPGPATWLKPEQFPPMKDFEGQKQVTSTWLGVRSPAVQSSVKMRSAILGAIALTPPPRYRHMFSSQRLFGGRCTIDDNIMTSFGEPHTPPMMEPITIDDADIGWLTILADKLLSKEKNDRRQINSLEYYYRAWPLGQSERFPILCMTLDALFGDASQATQSVIERVRIVLGDHVDPQRLRLLMELRASVIHGGAPDVYESRKYARYYTKYGEDPIYDLELVVAHCLRKVAFDDLLVEHADPHASRIAEMQLKGRMPKQLDGTTILAK